MWKYVKKFQNADRSRLLHAFRSISLTCFLLYTNFLYTLVLYICTLSQLHISTSIVVSSTVDGWN